MYGVFLCGPTRVFCHNMCMVYIYASGVMIYIYIRVCLWGVVCVCNLTYNKFPLHLCSTELLIGFHYILLFTSVCTLSPNRILYISVYLAV